MRRVAILPPIARPLSTTVTCMLRSRSTVAAIKPEIPPPITKQEDVDAF